MGTKDLKIRDTGSLVMSFLALVFTIMYVSLIFNKNIWTDEAYTIQLVSGNDLAGIVRGTAEDVHPPLYYLIVKIIVMLFDGHAQVDLFWLYKLVSVLPMLLTMLLAFIYIRPWWGARTGVLFLALLNAIPCLMEYAVQIRMYSWALFFVTWAGFCAYGMCRQGKGWYHIQLAVASVFGCYTHTYAMLSCVCIYLLAGLAVLYQVRKEHDLILFRRWFLSGAAVALCYLPWLDVLLRQTADRIGDYWIGPVTGREILGYLSFLFDSGVPYSTAMYVALCGLAAMICVRRCARGDRDALAALMMFGVPLLTACIGILVSVTVTPFFIARYLVPCMGLLAAFLAIALQKDDVWTDISIGAFCALMIVDVYQAEAEAEYRSTHTDGLLAYLDENMGPDDLIVYNYEDYGFIYRIYFEDRKIMFLNDVDLGGDFSHIWYLDSCVTPWLDAQALTDHGLEKEFVMNTGIEQNELHLYRIYARENR